MKKLEIDALRKSIRMWQSRASGIEVGEEEQCPLCAYHTVRFVDGEWVDCTGCVVCLKSEANYTDEYGKKAASDVDFLSCQRTPYEVAHRTAQYLGQDSVEGRATAAKEVDFLISCMPKKRRNHWDFRAAG